MDFLYYDKFKFKPLLIYSDRIYIPMYNISLDVSSVLRLTIRFLFYHTIDKIMNFQ